MHAAGPHRRWPLSSWHDIVPQAALNSSSRHGCTLQCAVRFDAGGDGGGGNGDGDGNVDGDGGGGGGMRALAPPQNLVFEAAIEGERLLAPAIEELVELPGGASLGSPLKPLVVLEGRRGKPL